MLSDEERNALMKFLETGELNDEVKEILNKFFRDEFFDLMLIARASVKLLKSLGIESSWV